MSCEIEIDEYQFRDLEVIFLSPRRLFRGLFCSVGKFSLQSLDLQPAPLRDFNLNYDLKLLFKLAKRKSHGAVFLVGTPR